MFDVVGLSVKRVPVDDLPPGRLVELPGRGTTFVAEMDGPPGAPTLFLIHGLVASSYVNWFPAFEALRGRYRVVTTDLRGHGRGIDPGHQFRLTDCADDVAALADALGIERFVPVGYSLGGPVAQLVWQRHRERVEGLVLCATSRNFGGTARERAFYRSVLGGVAAIRLAHRVRRPADDPSEPEAGPLPDVFGDAYAAAWALREVRQSRPEVLLRAMHAMGRFSSHHWIGDVDVPTAVVVTTQDRFIAPTRQLKLARAIPGATIHPCHAGHAACVLGARRFVPALVEACDSVAQRLPAHAGAHPVPTS